MVNEELARLVSASLGEADPVGPPHSVGDYAKLSAELADVEVIRVIRSERVGSPQDPGQPQGFATKHD